MTCCNEKQMPCEWAQIGGGCSVSACRKVLFTAGGWPMPTKPPEFVKPPITNADRIRAMSDEELAATMYGLTELDERIHFCQNKAECDALLEKGEEIPEQNCVGCLVAWLQQPAEEDA